MGIYDFRSDDAFAFAREQGIKAKIKNGELHMYDCPYCHGAGHGDKYTFSINLSTGQFKCLRESCGVTGNKSEAKRS